MFERVGQVLGWIPIGTALLGLVIHWIRGRCPYIPWTQRAICVHGSTPHGTDCDWRMGNVHPSPQRPGVLQGILDRGLLHLAVNPRSQLAAHAPRCAAATAWVST